MALRGYCNETSEDDAEKNPTDSLRSEVHGRLKRVQTQPTASRENRSECANRPYAGAEVQRCQWHKRENVVSYLPMMEQSLFGSQFQSAQELLRDEDDPVKLIEMTPRVARAIYESETSNLGLLRHASGFSPALRKMEQEFERIRYDAQEQRVRSLFDARKARRGLSLDEARRILWMYTSRDVYRMLVHEAGWTPDRYQTWLSTTLLEALVDARAR